MSKTPQDRPVTLGELTEVEDPVWAVQDTLFGVQSALAAIIATLVQADPHTRRNLLRHLQAGLDQCAALHPPGAAPCVLLESLLAAAQDVSPCPD